MAYINFLTPFHATYNQGQLIIKVFIYLEDDEPYLH